MHRHVPGTLGTRNGNVERGTSFCETTSEREYTHSVCSQHSWNVFQVLPERRSQNDAPGMMHDAWLLNEKKKKKHGM
jgi:hypothetical protein